MKIKIGIGHCPYCGEKIILPFETTVYCGTLNCTTYLYMYSDTNYRARNISYHNLERLKIKEVWTNQKSHGIYAKILVDGKVVSG